MLKTGRVYTFHYPRHNFYGVRSKLEPRRVIVIKVRDLKADPIERKTFKSNPLVRRGRWLVECVDLNKEALRSFYVDSMRRVKEETLKDR